MQQKLKSFLQLLSIWECTILAHLIALGEKDLKQGPIHTVQLYISETRFEQLKRYLHISDSQEKISIKKEWWYRVEPLASIFHKAARKYYTPGSELSVDELMIQCFGRSLHTVKMPKKPIKQGYKVFALAEHGYIWTFSWSSRKQGIMEMFRYSGLTYCIYGNEYG